MEATTAAGIQDQFLNLLTTQLRHQDPLEPTKQEDFIAQLAQFSTLQGIEKLNENFSNFMSSQASSNADASLFSNMASAANLVGTEVLFSSDNVLTDGSKEQSKGVVESVVMQNDAVHLRIDNKLVPLSQLQEIGNL